MQSENQLIFLLQIMNEHEEEGEIVEESHRTTGLKETAVADVPFYRWGNCGLEISSHLSKITQLLSLRQSSGLSNSSLVFPRPALFPFPQSDKHQMRPWNSLLSRSLSTQRVFCYFILFFKWPCPEAYGS